MGLRLDVYSKDRKINFYGTKHYGYNFVFADQEKAKCFPSFNYLMELGKIDIEDLWDYGCSPTIELTAEEFEHFITLYSKEVEMSDEEYEQRKREILQKFKHKSADKFIALTFLEDAKKFKLLEQKEIVELLAYKGNKIIEWC